MRVLLHLRSELSPPAVFADDSWTVSEAVSSLFDPLKAASVSMAAGK